MNRRRTFSAIVFAVALWGGWHMTKRSTGQAELRHGRALFDGSEALQGRLAGHEADLPPEAVKCINCHPIDRRATPPSTRGEEPSALESFAPELTRARLKHPMPRRGGPPSTYDAHRFCRLLRDGVDPAQVMVPQTMPRYTLTDEECSALWTYATSQ